MEAPPSPTLNAILSAVDVSALMAAASPSNSASETTSMTHSSSGLLPNGKKTKGRVKIKMEYISNKLRRYTTFSKRKTGIMKKAYELSTLTGTQVMLLVASETGHVYTFATKKLTPMISSEQGKGLIQQCLSQPDGQRSLHPQLRPSSDPDNNVAPNRSEFTFDGGASGSRKRRAPTGSTANSDTDASIASFLPTMVPTSLFHPYTDEDYQEDVSDDVSEAEDGGEDSKSEEQLAEEENKKDISTTTLQQTIKEALKAAANNRASIAAAKKRKINVCGSPSTPHQPVIPSSLLAPFLMTAALASSSSPEEKDEKSRRDSQGRTLIFSGPQGVVYAPDSIEDDGGAAASALLAGAKSEDTHRLLSSFPFNFNLQQLLENAALQAAKAE
ncbi:hypothetical protein PMAYCL1PPCAC_29623 [Pristionchus mayeri]|uniref:Serum response factor homolog n=1 Tax=Pristionchus mayeri TaxID=1317129 RepID=A0AAN5IB14_9BILA|nr:hypothetical protein PMAYCL1PPCAC_29623 [Pristionchus mayeri]